MSNTLISKIYKVLHKAVSFGQHLTKNTHTKTILTYTAYFFVESMSTFLGQFRCVSKKVIKILMKVHNNKDLIISIQLSFTFCTVLYSKPALSTFSSAVSS